MKPFLVAFIAATLLCFGGSIASADAVDPGWTPSNCTPPLAVITMPNGNLTVKTTRDVRIETRPGSDTMVFSRSGYPARVTVTMTKANLEEGAKTLAVQVSGGDMRTTRDGILYVYLPGGTVCPNGAPAPLN